MGDIGAGPALCAYQEGIRKKFFHAPSSPKVGPKLGEQCRTQVPTSAGSGNLQPTLDEEPCAPSGARPACCLPLHLTVLQSLGERCDQVPGVPPVVTENPDLPVVFYADICRVMISGLKSSSHVFYALVLIL